MSNIIYYLAKSIDGYIAGPNQDASMFVTGGNGVEQYLADLKDFKTVIMGRKTYEFGYKYGLKPGQPPYPHMQHHIFSDKMELPNCAPNVHVEKMSLNRVNEIKAASETDIYLCGGGQLAGWLLENDLIDILKIKLNPILLGRGIRLFGDSTKACHWKLLEQTSYSDGLQIITYIPE